MAERHPVQERPDLPVELRLQLLEQHLAQLWDAVWWLSLPEEQRKQFEDEGFKHPIEKFYEEVDG